jgi:hypothetical protein
MAHASVKSTCTFFISELLLLLFLVIYDVYMIKKLVHLGLFQKEKLFKFVLYEWCQEQPVIISLCEDDFLFVYNSSSWVKMNLCPLGFSVLFILANMSVRSNGLYNCCTVLMQSCK